MRKSNFKITENLYLAFLSDARRFKYLVDANDNNSFLIKYDHREQIVTSMSSRSEF